MRTLLNVSLLFVVLTVSGMAGAEDFTPYTHFPVTARYNVVGTAVPNGRLLLWNGDKVFLQSRPDADEFNEIASGYAGDPAFLILSPDGHTALLGAGGYGTDTYVDKIYRFDVNQPGDFGPESTAATISHYGAAFLTETLVLIDAGAGDWTNSLLVVLDISGAKSAPIAVVRKPAAKAGTVLNKPGYSAALTVDYANDMAYVMDGTSLELRSFSVQALVDAYAGHTLLDWTADGTLIGSAGQYFNGGVSGMTLDGNLVIGGAFGWGLDGGIQLVNPANGVIVDTLDPSGEQAYTSVIVNSVTGRITAVASGTTYVQGAFTVLPAVGGFGLIVLCAALVAARSRKRP